MPAQLTDAQRQAMYQAIFRGIPGSFLDPSHPDNQAVIGAIAYAVGYAKALYNQMTNGLFLDTANDNDIGADGLTSLDRWFIWLKMERVPGETVEQAKARLQAKLFSPRCTLDIIESAVIAATGLTVTIEEPNDEIVRLNDGPWTGKRLMGSEYAYGAFRIVTEGQALGANGGMANGLHKLVPMLRGGGIHWRHLEIVSYNISLLLEGKQASVTSDGAWMVKLWPEGFKLNTPPNLNAFPLRPRYTYNAGSSTGARSRINWGAGAMYIEGPPGAPTETVLANYVPAGLPIFVWDDSDCLWDESVWAD